MRNRIRLLALLGIVFALHMPAYAAYGEITFRYDHHLFSLRPSQFPQWKGTKEVWYFHGKRILPPASLRVDGDELPALPQGMVRSQEVTWSTDAIRATLKERIADVLDREPGSVRIGRTADGYFFDGVGLPGRKVNLDALSQLTVRALEAGIWDVVIPLEEMQPVVAVLDASLQDAGIREVISVGESDYRGSPLARQHNIGVGLSKFNGHLVGQGETFSFNEVLGDVNGVEGYKRELVILGEKTVPEYGGGLCQVSTTMYRGVWEYGFPIEQRRNHSYSVRYYSPQGTDATIYPPHTDVKFVNDSPGSILIQTYNDDENDKAYFIYYGTRDDRKTEVAGPYVWGHRAPPPDRIEHTTEIPPGTERKLGERVPGLKASWFRVVQSGDEEIIDSTYSAYEARPLYLQIGVEEGSALLASEPKEEDQDCKDSATC